jgi:hypothetical protein
MGSIFLSYRREDAEGQAGRLYDDLVAAFGSDSVFMDVAAIQPGRDFRKAIDQSLGSCGVFLSLIGKGWLTAKDLSGQRRLDDVADFVRIETAAALKRDIPVIPVLVQGAPAPKPDQLPDDLKDLAYRNAIELTHPRWDSDVQLLIKALRAYVSSQSPRPEPAPVPPRKKILSPKSLALIAACLVLVAGLASYLWSQKKAINTPATESGQTITPQDTANPVVPQPTAKPANKHADAVPAANAPVKPRGLEDVSLAAEQVPLPNNPKRYTYTLSLNLPAEMADSIDRVHYDLVYDTNPLSLDGGPAPAFSAQYEGWGCYETVVVTVYLKSSGSQSLNGPLAAPQWINVVAKSSGSQPLKKTFNMCESLKGGAGSERKKS